MNDRRGSHRQHPVPRALLPLPMIHTDHDERRSPDSRCDHAREKFVHDFVAAWVKVMNLGRYDLA
jgi:hypothetical protein